MSLNILVDPRPETPARRTLSPSTSASLPTSILRPNAKQWRRRIPPSEGRAIEILGHAIEYLADEFAFHSGTLPSLNSDDPQIQAIQMLMAANRQVYFSCPVIPPLGVRLLNSLFHWKRPDSPIYLGRPDVLRSVGEAN